MYHLPIWPITFSNSCPALTNLFTVLNAVVAADAGAVTLSHNNSAKLATTATGVDVTGLITTDAITETSAGKVGIGTVSPPQKFVVSNAGADNIVMSENSSASIQMFMQATSGTGSVGTLTNHDVQFLANNSEKARITSFGDVGIGRSDPQNIVGNSISGSFPSEIGKMEKLNELILCECDFIH